MIFAKVKEHVPSKVTLCRPVAELLKKASMTECQICLDARNAVLPVIQVFIFTVLWRKQTFHVTLLGAAVKKKPHVEIFFFLIGLFKVFSSFLFVYLFIYLWLCWVFVSVRGLSLVAQVGATLHRGARASHCRGLSCCGARAPDAQAQ